MAYIPSLAFQNRELVSYTKGDEFTDGSQRINYSNDPNGPNVFEERIDGFWVSSFVIDGEVGQFVFDDDGVRVTR